MCSHHNIWAHKWPDVRRCPHCNKLMFVTANRTTDSTQETIVDYLIYTGRYHWIECKGGGTEHLFSLNSITQPQHNFMDSWVKRGEACWLFVLMGTGPWPNRAAWLVSWIAYTRMEEAMIEDGKKSFSLKYDCSFNDISPRFSFPSYELSWQSNVGWTIPPTHPLYEEVSRLPKLK
jgi:hypothetical protein